MVELYVKMGRLTEYFHYMNTKNLTSEWMKLNYFYFFPTENDKRDKEKYCRKNREKSCIIKKKRQLF